MKRTRSLPLLLYGCHPPEGSFSSSTTSSRKLRIPGSDDETSGKGAFDTPVPTISMTETSGQTYGIADKDSDSRYPRLAEETMRSILGPMPTDKFLDTFLHRREMNMSKRPPCEGAFAEVQETGTESGIYIALLNALKACEGKRCPGFTFWDTSSFPDTSGPTGSLGSHKPDICSYAKAFLQFIKFSKKHKKAKITDMGYVAFWFEIKPNRSDDYFCDPPKVQTEQASLETHDGQDTRTDPASVDSQTEQDVKGKGKAAREAMEMERQERDAWDFVMKGWEGTKRKEGMKNLGQTISYATETFKRQHRHSCFSVSICGTSARFIRWDRAGAIVSEAFSLHESPNLLCDFLWCFAHVSNSERGYDLTVEPATTAEETQFREAIEKHIRSQLHVTDNTAFEELVKEHHQQGSVTAIHLPLPAAPDADATLGRRILASRPIVVPQSLTGRSTRTYWALDTSSGNVVLLKDTWRSEVFSGSKESGVLEREGDILEKLTEQKVENVPAVVYHGDVPQVDEFKGDDGPAINYFGVQMTFSQDYVSAPWVCGSDLRRFVVQKRTHYRMTLDIAGYCLLRLQGTTELFHAAYDAFNALRQAYDKTKRLHRDVHPGNIILFNKNATVTSSAPRTGFLVDWDCSMDPDTFRPLPDDISAKWQFVAQAVCVHSHRNLTHPNYSKREATEFQTIEVKFYKIQHDMESILYVVFYCALLWTPHRITGPFLRHILWRVFDECSLIEGLPVGGAGKLENMKSRQYSSGADWKCKLMEHWLAVVMDYLHPIATTPKDRRLKWTPKHLDEFWSGFLSCNEAVLQDFRNDRVSNIARYSSDFGNSAPHSVLAQPHQGTRAGSGVNSAYKRVARDPVDERDAKRRRLRMGDDEDPPDYEDSSESEAVTSASTVRSTGAGSTMPPDSVDVSETASTVTDHTRSERAQRKQDRPRARGASRGRGRGRGTSRGTGTRGSAAGTLQARGRELRQPITRNRVR
ncbi:hypothetical protein C8Q80DRAFT_417160 [Daedaleopsis nitida]|nr:hypothetical protein C8Q80DRAFT_417160 [Daedaleopsis nitida]